MRKITVPAGIGDNCWLFQKLINSGEKFDFILPDGQPQRGHQIFELMPQLCNSVRYQSGLSYRKLAELNIQAKKSTWAHIKLQEFYLSANSHLEAGQRIEKFLPDLPTSYKLDFATSDDDKLNAEIILPSGAKYIGIYGSAYKNARHSHYNGWGPDEWFKFIQMLYKGDKKFVFVIIGALYDEDLAKMLMEKLDRGRIPFIDSIGQPLSVVIEMLKRLHYFAGFPSGLSILNEVIGQDGLMWYGPKIKGIINTWADPERIKNGNIKECLFCEPEKIFNWLRDEYNIFDH